MHGFHKTVLWRNGKYKTTHDFIPFTEIVNAQSNTIYFGIYMHKI